jgi:hypothetical protein
LSHDNGHAIKWEIRLERERIKTWNFQIRLEGRSGVKVRREGERKDGIWSPMIKRREAVQP